MTNKNYKKIRIFIGSPVDVKEERESVKSIVTDLNQTGGIADQKGFFLEVLDWSTHVAPQMGRPEKIILEQLPVNKWDLFLGILWQRFGSPTGGIDPDTGDQYSSGTEEEFELAYKAWKMTRRPHIQFYRCNSDLTPTEINWEQALKVHSFFERFKHDGERPGLYELYEDVAEFEKKIQRNLVKYLNHVYDELKKSPLYSIDRIEGSLKIDEYVPGHLLEKEFKVGESYQFSLMSIDIVDSTKLVLKYTSKKFQIVINSFFDLVSKAVRQYKGDIFSWAGDGGILVFWGANECERAVLAGISILQELFILNLNKKKISIKDSLKIRIAIHYGNVEFQIPLSKIASDCISFVSHMEKKNR